MSLLAKHSIIKEDKSNIITLGALAKKAKEKDDSVINATIGMLYDEAGKLITFESVDKVLMQLSAEEKYAYSSTPGNADYHEALKQWIFREYYEELLSTMHCSVMATPGGSGAISNTFSNYLNQGDMVLLPEYMWGNYKQFAYENFATFTTYKMFKDQAFNLEDVAAKIKMLKERQGRVVLVINDPCHNPTGYTMSKEEWIQLVAIINESSKDGTPFVLLYDMAYIDYDARGFQATRENIRLFQQFGPTVVTILAFSGSKTLALYGLRIGAQIALCKDKMAVEEFFQANKFSSRAKWSTATNLGMNLISKIILTPELRTSFEKELDDARHMLVQRANAFLENAQKAGLVTLPFNCGFFITIPCDNSEVVYERLVGQGIHIIPLGNVLRVTIAAISLSDCILLPEKIAAAMKK